jgi:hypothetical protein
MKPIATQH